MANCNAIKMRPSKDSKPTAGNLCHNSGLTKKVTYWLKNGKNIIQSQSYKNVQELNKDWKTWTDEAKERYKNNPYKKNALRSDAVIMEEALIIIGTDVKADTETIVKIIKDYIQEFEKQHKTKVRHWAYHHDHEGHVNDNGEECINRHVHFIFDNVNLEGKMIRRELPKQYFSQMQDDIYRISKKYINDIERASHSTYKTVEIEGREVQVNEKKSTHHRKFRMQKEIEQKSRMASQKDLKEEINKLRAQLKQNGAIREDYARLEQLNKDLKEQIKRKDLSIERMHKIIKDVTSERNHLANVVVEQNKKIAKLKDFKEEVAQTREKLRSENATKEDFKNFESYTNALKKEIKKRDLSIEQMQHKINEYKYSTEYIYDDDTVATKDDVISFLHDNKIELEEEIRNLNLELNSLESEITREKKKLKKVEYQNKIQTIKIQDLENKIQEMRINNIQRPK